MPPFWLYEELMVVFVGKTVYLVLNRRAVARAAALYAPGEHGRARETCPQNIMRVEVCVCNIAWLLISKSLGISERELSRILIAGLYLESREVDGPAIDTHRGAGL